MNKWILTDDSTGQHVLKSDPEHDVFHLIDTVAYGIDLYAVVIGTVVFDAADGYDVYSPDFAACYLHPYGYESFEDVQQQYGEFAMQIAAECVFETQSLYLNQSIFEGTLNKCIDFIETYVQNQSAIPTLSEGDASE